MAQTLKWYAPLAHEDSEILEEIERQYDFLSPEVKEKLVANIHDLFYEVGFLVESDNATGEIIKRSLAE